MSQKLLIQIVHGPNLNLLGTREKLVYGVTTLASIDDKLKTMAEASGVSVSCFQSNHEGEIIDAIHKNHTKTQGILINPGALTHTSIALRDALLSVSIPTVEVHLSNIFARETFRRHSFISDVVLGTVVGFGALSYELGWTALLEHIKKHQVVC